MENSISMPISIYALGGLGEVGKNMYCVENDNTIVIIDAGVRFPGIEFPGIDYIVPDFVHVLYKGKIVKSAGKELALELEEKGYDWVKKELGE